MSYFTQRSIIFLLAILAALLGCSDSSTGPQGGEIGASVNLVAKLDAGVVAVVHRAEVVVTATDMPVMRQDLNVEGERLVGVVGNIPAGPAREFSIEGYDEAGLVVVRGRVRLDLVAGQVAPLWISLSAEPIDVADRRMLTVELVPGVTMDMVWVEAGVFTMGSPLDEWGRNEDEGPQFQVSLSRGFYLGRCEVTQHQWEAVTGTRPWHGAIDALAEGSDRPAVHISWVDVQDFIGQLNAAAGAELYRLPTEAEWEYAGRSGTQSPWFFGHTDERLDLYAWWADNTAPTGRPSAQAVGLKSPNPWGLYDMHGNVWEWVGDWLGPYPGNPQSDPRGPDQGTARVFRGGSFTDVASFSRSAQRCWNAPDLRFNNVGVRLVRVR